MKTFIGKSASGLQGNPALDPANKGVAPIAQARLDNIVSRANARHQEALTVDGITAFIWRRTKRGKFCTCRSMSGSPQYRDSKSRVMDPSGGSLKQPSPTDDLRFHDGIAPTPDIGNSEVFVARGNEVYAPPGSLEEKINEAVFTPDDDEALFNNSSDEYDPLMEASIDALADGGPDEEARLMKTLEIALMGSETKRCGICFGTGQVDGYQLHGGRRYVLDYTESYGVLTCNGFSVNRDKSPFTFSGSVTDEPLEFLVNLPTYFADVESDPLVMLNTIRTKYLLVEVFSSGEWLTFDRDYLLSRKGLNNRGLRIRVRVDSSLGLDGVVEFTHVEFTLIVNALPKLHLPDLTIPFDPALIEPIINSNMELGAGVGELKAGTLIYETKHNRLWRVTDASVKRTTKNQIFGMEAQVILVARENYMNLLIPYRERHKWLLPYAGLERVQGIR
jgi:hypothetical protein